MEESETYHKITQESEDVYSTDYGWGLYKDDDNSSAKSSKYRRTYTWNERNQLISSVDSNYSTAYVYGQDGQRTNKYTQNSETLYFNKMWTLHTDSGNSVYGGQTAKNIYLGETRIVTKLNGANYPTYQEEYYKQYYYHSDHLGSASLISDYNGDEYQRIEYTPYGETWVEKTSNTGMEYLPYKFTGKEMDEETGLYYYGARYLDPKYSMWISTDPALGEYSPIASTNDEAKRHNSNLPGMGGVFNHINFNLYHSVIDLSKFAKVGKVAGNIGTGLTLYSLGSEFFGRESLTIDNVISKTVGSYIKGKSHEAVSKSYNYAKTQILKMISTGKLSYKANKNCEVEFIKFDKETHAEIKNLIKELKQMEQNNE